MKTLILTTISLSLAVLAFSQKYTIVDAESKVKFVIKNFGLNTNGNFKGLMGNIVFDPNALNASSFAVSVNASSINTDNTLRDKHLKKENYFNSEKYPLISFVTTKISKTNSNGYFLANGNLTIKGITNPIEFIFSANPTSRGYFFKGEFEINRLNYNVGGNSISLSENLKVMLEVTTIKN